MEEFESRVEKFIQVNIESDECSHWVDILRLEFGGEDKFCGDGFTNAVSEFKRELKTVMIFIIIFLIPLKRLQKCFEEKMELISIMVQFHIFSTIIGKIQFCQDI